MMVWRPFYFANLIVDPKDENKVYKPGGSLIVSNDGGASFSFIGGGAHGDFHDVWIDPGNTNELITGDDGGVWYSHDCRQQMAGRRTICRSAQFYHVSVDMARSLPRLRRTAGQQRLDRRFGVSRRHHQQPLGKSVRRRWLLRFCRSRRSELRLCRSAGRDHLAREPASRLLARSIQPQPNYGESKLRFNWNTPIAYESQRKGHHLYRRAVPVPLARSRPDLGPHFAGPDHQRSGKTEAGGIRRRHRRQFGRRNAHHHLFHQRIAAQWRRTIWVGTDDGNLQLTRDGGKTWTNVVGQCSRICRKLPGSPGWRPAASIAATAYAAFDRHTFGDMDSARLQDHRLRQDLDADRRAKIAACAASRT